MLAISAVLNTALSLFYYARVARAMYLESPRDAAPIAVGHGYGAIIASLVVPTVVLGVWWGPVYDFLARSMAMQP